MADVWRVKYLFLVLCILQLTFWVQSAEEFEEEREPTQTIQNKQTSEEQNGAIAEPNFRKQNYVKVIHEEEVKQDSEIAIEFYCLEDSVIGVDIDVQDKIILSRTWECTSGHSPQQHVIILKIPDNIMYQLSQIKLDASSRILPVKFQAWLVPKSDWLVTQATGESIWKYAKTGVTRNANFLLEVGMEDNEEEQTWHSYYWEVEQNEKLDFPSTVCEYEWWDTSVFNIMHEAEYQHQYNTFQINICKKQPEVVQLVKYPLALGNAETGLSRMLPQFTEWELVKMQEENRRKPRFTICLFMYIIEFCPSGGLCSILQHHSWDDRFLTPLLAVKQNGAVHMQVSVTGTSSSSSVALVSPFILPKKQWIKFTLGFDNRNWNMTVNYGKNWKETLFTKYSFPQDLPIYYDDLEGVLLIGGSEVLRSFQGFVSHAVIYREKIVQPDEIPNPPSSHPMYELQLEELSDSARCKDYKGQFTRAKHNAKVLLMKINKRKTCKSASLLPYLRQSLSTRCTIYDQPGYFNYGDKWLAKHPYASVQIFKKHMRNYLFQEAVSYLEEPFMKADRAVDFLKQSSCYGNENAGFILSALLSYGIGTPVNETESNFYLMYGALHNYRKADLALGNKHKYGLDGVPFDFEQAYAYYKKVADRTHIDKEKHSVQDVYTEKIRLTDDEAVDSQTHKEDDLYQWLKYQAETGVSSAQTKLARLLYWGSQGVERNLEEAAEYYQVAAENEELEDPQALYDYGIVMIKGQGVEKNMSGGIYHIKKAADMGYEDAINALGWYALNHELNYTKAAEYFERAYKQGNINAAHNLGYMYQAGRYPGLKEKDRVKAWQLFYWAASYGQLEAGIMVAYHYIRGNPVLTRNPYMAAEWAQFIAEKNPVVGELLRKGLKAYKDHQRHKSLFYYLLAAYTGVEVGNFNLAYLCEDNHDDVTHFMGKECTFRHYNLSVQRQDKFVDSHSFIKMGDYYYNLQNTKVASLYYAKAAPKEPQGLFNLALLVEDGSEVSDEVWELVSIPHTSLRDRNTVLTELYSRCLDTEKSEAYIPCRLALLRVQITEMANRFLSYLMF